MLSFFPRFSLALHPSSFFLSRLIDGCPPPYLCCRVGQREWHEFPYNPWFTIGVTWLTYWLTGPQWFRYAARIIPPPSLQPPGITKERKEREKLSLTLRKDNEFRFGFICESSRNGPSDCCCCCWEAIIAVNCMRGGREWEVNVVFNSWIPGGVTRDWILSATALLLLVDNAGLCVPRVHYNGWVFLNVGPLFIARTLTHLSFSLFSLSLCDLFQFVSSFVHTSSSMVSHFGRQQHLIFFFLFSSPSSKVNWFYV